MPAKPFLDYINEAIEYIREEDIMKIAVPTRDGRVDDHFGHCAYYTIFDVIDGKVTNISKMASPQGCGCKSGIAPVLRQM